MDFRHRLRCLKSGVAGLAIGVALAGCGTGGTVTPVGTDGATQTDSGLSFQSPAGTSDLQMVAAKSGATVMKSFDPGAFARSSGSADDGLGPAEFDDGGGSEPPPPPPPDDGGGDTTFDSTLDDPFVDTFDDGTGGTFDDGTGGTFDDGTGGTFDETFDTTFDDFNDGTFDSTFDDGTFDGTFDEFNDGTFDGTFDEFDDGTHDYYDDSIFSDFEDISFDDFGGFDEFGNFDQFGTFDEFGEFFDPFDVTFDGEVSEFFDEQFFADGFEPEFQDEFGDFFFDEFSAFHFEGLGGDFFDPSDFIDDGGEFIAFDQFDFATMLENVELDQLFEGMPPHFEDDFFGEFVFGELPPPPFGFRDFPPPPNFLDEFGVADFVFDFDFDFQIDFDNLDGFVPPDGLPAEFFLFDAHVNEFNGFIDEFDFGFFDEFGDEGPGFDPRFGGQFMPFDEVAEFLPEGFLLPDQALARFLGFGQDHPLISDDGKVNRDLELAFHDRPPIPEGFEGFDFEGDCPQFDDLFTLYDADKVGETLRGQVNTTFSEELFDGSTVFCSETTVLESSHGEATPLVEMVPGLFQTQWVVNIRQQTTAQFLVQHPDFPDDDIEAEQTREILSQMTWTMIMKEVDTDGDGIPDEMQVTGSNVIEILSSSFDGELPDILGELGPPPELLLDLNFDGVLGLQAGGATEGL